MDFLQDQLITYIGNKRKLLDFIGIAINQIKSELNKSDKDKLSTADLFSGSGVVSRFLKQFSYQIQTNDLENYAYTINKCYLNINKKIYDELLNLNLEHLFNEFKSDNSKSFILDLYAPKDENNITESDRVFYTRKNAEFIDKYRQFIDTLPNYKDYLLAPLLYQASVKVNTSGVFKGFHKNGKIGQYGGKAQNCLSRIKSDIEILLPVYSDFETTNIIYKDYAENVAGYMETCDVTYIDPPYNQHTYGSNYFMLNLINDYIRPTEISKISGIPNNFNRSIFNSKSKAESELVDLISKIKSKYIIMSYNNEGFINYDTFTKSLSKIGKLDVLEQDYNTYRGSRNLNQRDIKVKELLFILRKY